MRTIGLFLASGLVLNAVLADDNTSFSSFLQQSASLTRTIPTLTLDEVLRAAVRSFPGLIAVQQRQEAATGEALSAQGAFDTTLKLNTRWSIAGLYENQYYDVAIEQPTGLWGTTFFGGWRRGTGYYPIYEGKSVTNENGEFRGGVNIPLWRNGPIDRRRAQVAQTELGQFIAGLDYDAAVLDLQRVVAQRYWDWVLAGTRAEVARTLLAIAEQRNRGIIERVAAGDLPAMEVTENQRAILERQERTVSAERTLQQASFLLSLYWRDAEGKPQLPTLDQNPIGFPELRHKDENLLQEALDSAHRQRPELRKLEQQKKQAEIERDLQQNQQAPGVDISLVGAQDIGLGNKLANKEELYAGITIDLPLQRRVARGRTEAAEAQLRRIDAEYQLTSDRITIEVKDALSAMEAARKRIHLTRQQRDAARILEEGERARFELGDSNLLFVNVRELASGDAALAENDALNAFFKAQADYQFALGQTILPEKRN